MFHRVVVFMQLVQLLYIADILVWHPEDGHRSDRNMSANSNIW